MTDTDKLYKIKPLTWFYREQCNDWAAETPFGIYMVTKDEWSYCGNGHSDEDESPCNGYQEGKAAAEAHWRERILPMLEEVE